MTFFRRFCRVGAAAPDLQMGSSACPRWAAAPVHEGRCSMRGWYRVPVPLLLLILGAAPAWGADLKQIPRTIARQPVYRSKAPKFCLLVFGPEAKFRVWLVQDGNDFLIDHNGNGDLTEPGKRGKGSRILTEPNGTTHKLFVRWFRGRNRVLVWLRGKFRQYAGWNDEDPLRFADRPADAPVIHFDGPLGIRFYNKPPVLPPGRVVEIDLTVGTPGLGKGSFAAVGACNGGCPTAEFVIPHRDPGRQPHVLRSSVGDD